MFHLCNVLQLVIYRFYDGTFPEQQFVRHAHQSTFHVVFKFGDKLYAVHEQALEKVGINPTFSRHGITQVNLALLIWLNEKVLADIAFVCDQLPVYEFNEGLVFQRFPVIHISRGYHEVEQLTLFVTNQMQPEAKEPSHGTLASLRNAPEHLVDMYPLVPAHSKGSAVHETYACTFPKQYLLDEQSKRYGNFLFKFHETVV